jgi:hypothetical protein
LLDWSGRRINSHDPLRGHVLKHMRRTTPDQPALLGGAQGIEKRKVKVKINVKTKNKPAAFGLAGERKALACPTKK